MQWLVAHEAEVLMVALTISETLAFVFPNAGGILKGVISGLKALGAKDVDGQ